MRSPSVALQTAYYDELYGRQDTYTDGVLDALIGLRPSLICPCSVGSVGVLNSFVPGLPSDIATPIYNDGQWLGVYSDMAPTSERGPYITIGQQTMTDDADKTVFGSVATQAVGVVTAFDGDRGGKRLSSLIADEVIRRIRKRTAPDLSPAFNCITSTLDSSITLTERTATTTIIRAELRFRHIIEEI
jgi:hypothetical protein